MKTIATTLILPLMATSVMGMGQAQAITSSSDALRAFSTTTTVPEQPELNDDLSVSVDETQVAYEYSQGCYIDSYGNMKCW